MVRAVCLLLQPFGSFAKYEINDAEVSQNLHELAKEAELIFHDWHIEGEEVVNEES